MTPPPLAPEDLGLIRRFAAGRVPARAWGRELFIRLLWAHIRLLGARDALPHLLRAGRAGGAPTLPPAEDLRVWVWRVRDADAADVTPARTSAEFVWRHGELLGSLWDDADAPKPGDADDERACHR